MSVMRNGKKVGRPSKSQTLKTAGAIPEKNTILPDSAINVSAETHENIDPGRGKNQDKNIRAPIGEEEDVNKLSQKDKIRMATGRQARLDVSFYERLPEYEGMQLFWENDINGAVETWLQLGAELVSRQTRSLKQFKGFTDQNTGEWECRPVGTDDSGKTMYAFLLFLPKEEYHELRIAPKDARNKEIMNALGAGKQQTDKIMGNVTGIKTYAPNNPVGDKRGFEQTHDT